MNDMQGDTFQGHDMSLFKPKSIAFDCYDTLIAFEMAPAAIPHNIARKGAHCRHDMGIRNKGWADRGHEPANSFYGYTEIKDIGGLAAVVGL